MNEEELREQVSELQKRVALLEQQLLQEKQKQQKKTRGAWATMSDEVSDENPYSRLMALKRMGVVRDYERIRTFSVAVVGMGGVGSVAAEMLARCGIGRLCLFDLDDVSMANMNRLFYRPEHVGLPKVAAAAQVLRDINPDVAVEPFACDVTTVANYGRLCGCLAAGVDLLLCCVDNYEARMAVNEACCEHNVPWLESGVSENALSGHVQLMLPGRTACFQCAPPLLVASEVSERSLKRDGVCAASLPTTMGLVAALLAQAALKHLLGFAPVSCFLGYNAFSDFFPRDVLRPNPECANEWCRRRQRECAAQGTALPAGYDPVDDAVRRKRALDDAAAAEAAAAAAQENEWGIQCVEESDGATDREKSEREPAQGLVYAYEVPKKGSLQLSESEIVHTDAEATVDDLAAQLAALNST